MEKQYNVRNLYECPHCSAGVESLENHYELCSVKRLRGLKKDIGSLIINNNNLGLWNKYLLYNPAYKYKIYESIKKLIKRCFNYNIKIYSSYI